MDFYEVVEKRVSCRSFKDRPVEEDKLNRILEATVKAPSAGNLKSYRIYLVKKDADKKKLAAACLDQEFVAEAPVVLVFCADVKRSGLKYGERGEQLYSVQDATIAAAYSQLAATAEGLGSVWVGAFDPFEVVNIITAEPYDVPIAVIPIGYPNEELKRRHGGRTVKDLVKKV